MPDTFFHGQQPYRELANLTSSASLACWNIRADQKGRLGQVKVINDEEKGKIIECIDKNLECTFPLAWGAISFDREFISLGEREMPHVGYLIQPALASGLEVFGFRVEGSYYDCGTPREYLEILKHIDHE